MSKKKRNSKWNRIGIADEPIDFFADYIVYTDGSCNNFSLFGEGGSAYIILNANEEVVKTASKGVLGSTNNRVEMLAILSSLKSLPDNCSVVIRTDSQYCINAFTHRETRFSLGIKNEDIIAMYNHESKRFAKIAFEWVKAHSGDYYNEIVNALSNERRAEIQSIYRIPVASAKDTGRPERRDLVERVNRMDVWMKTPESKVYHDDEAF